VPLPPLLLSPPFEPPAAPPLPASEPPPRTVELQATESTIRIEPMRM
jgi:hypothetical protein